MLHKARYYFELFSLPIFLVLTLHLASSGIQNLFQPHTDAHSHALLSLENFISYETVIGLGLVILFTWIWHRPMLKKWVPCSHDHCHDEQTMPHILAIIALCAHFFPEAEIRHSLIIMSSKQAPDLIVLLGFFSHFVVDVIVAIFISSFWGKTWQFWLSFLSIALVWIASAMLATSHYGDFLENGWFLLLSSFLLAMFIHKPHKPIKHCHNCD